jgi:hypothetical protein
LRAGDDSGDDVGLGLDALEDVVEAAEALLHLVVILLDEEAELGEFGEDLADPGVEFARGRLVGADRVEHRVGLLGPFELLCPGLFEVRGVADLDGLDLEAALQRLADGGDCLFLADAELDPHWRLPRRLRFAEHFGGHDTPPGSSDCPHPSRVCRRGNVTVTSPWPAVSRRGGLEGISNCLG